ncbi:MAG: hypothetical protein UR96_C0038G0001 [candidate division WS6 bacterium GW2011_GWC1_36_11]|uniref:Uncharacterized protein n=1 Tax=candidate division WS6 bacterium GW2011_GWC1_36_11 TaxID=1619090 RepID=A0A0G0GGK4_9BACT|nr:MAG: hypothetical protein UR96_C0038G0001 [candidate division WS6 bacterium GW2011_GWC1_36_11]
MEGQRPLHRSVIIHRTIIPTGRAVYFRISLKEQSYYTVQYNPM